jgi:putative transposase
MTEAKVLIEGWRAYYNTVRPHSSLGNMTPAEFSGQLPIRANVPDY